MGLATFGIIGALVIIIINNTIKILKEYERGVVFFLGGGYLEITDQQVLPPSASTELWLQVRDVRVAEEELRAAGVTVVEGAVEKPWGLIELRVADPDGLVLILVEVPPDHPLRRDHRSM